MRFYIVGGVLLWGKKGKSFVIPFRYLFFWTVWKERNRLAFREGGASNSES